jgi:predicted NodU family carbamoyl transferase
MEEPHSDRRPCRWHGASADRARSRQSALWGHSAPVRAATGLPVLVNTSFNAHEEPIVNQPAECVRALRDRRVDFVVTEQSCYAL